MSHFTVLVIGGDPDGLLEPYWELDLSAEEMINDPRAEFKIEVINTPSTGVIPPPGSRFNYPHDVETVDELFAKFKSEHPDRADQYGDIRQWLDVWHGFTYSEEHNAWGYWSNPYAKWDWYQIGGRWAGLLVLKPGKKGHRGEESWTWDGEGPYKPDDNRARVDQALFDDIDWDFMDTPTEKELKNMESIWYHNVENPLTNEQLQSVSEEERREILQFRSFYNRQYFVDRYGTLEKYIEAEGKFSTYAVLDAAGWHSPGDMGWFGMSTESHEDSVLWSLKFRENFLTNVDPTELITVVDCHI